MIRHITIYLLISILTFGAYGNVNAKSKVDSILSISESKDKVQELIELAFYTRINKKPGSEEIIRIADSVAKTDNLPYLSALTGVLSLSYNANTIDSGRFSVLNDSLQSIIKPFDDDLLNGEYNLALGNYYNFKNNADQSILSYLKGVEYFLRIQDSVKLAFTYNSVGIQYLKLNNNEVAMTFLRNGYSFLKKDSKGQLTLSLLNNIGLIYFRLLDYEKALTFYFRALEIMEGDKKQPGIIILYNNIADIYSAQKSYDKARIFLYKAYEESKYFNSRIDLAYQAHSFGIFYTNINKLDSAEYYFNKSMSGFEDLNYSYSLNRGYYDVSLLYLKQKKYNKAISHLNEAADFYKAYKNYTEYKNALNQISLNYEHLNNYKKALEYSRLENAYSDTILQAKNKRYLDYLDSKIELNREVEKFKQEAVEKNNKHQLDIEKHKRKNILFIFSSLILALVLTFIAIISSRTRATNEKLKLSENKLKINLKDREKFIQIMAHDLKSPFSSVLGITELLKNNFEEFPKDKIKELIGAIHESSNNIYNLLENLLEWTKTQSKNTQVNKTVFAIDETINLCLSLFEDQIRNKKLQLDISGCNNIQVNADKDMVQTIIRNLVSNAIKFTPENGSVSINMKPVNERLNIVVADTGVGIPGSNLEKLFNPHNSISTPGLNNEKGTGLGLIICHEFVRKHNAELIVKSELNKGTSFEFDLPLSYN